MNQPTPNRERPTLPMQPTPSHPAHRQPLEEHQPGTVTVDVTYRMTIPATWKTDGPVVPFLETAEELATVIGDALTIDADDAESMGYTEHSGYTDTGQWTDGEPVAVAVRWVRCQEIPGPAPEPSTLRAGFGIADGHPRAT
jgi:hypothetical protein